VRSRSFATPGIANELLRGSKLHRKTHRDIESHWAGVLLQKNPHFQNRRARRPNSKGVPQRSPGSRTNVSAPWVRINNAREPRRGSIERYGNLFDVRAPSATIDPGCAHMRSRPWAYSSYGTPLEFAVDDHRSLGCLHVRQPGASQNQRARFSSGVAAGSYANGVTSQSPGLPTSGRLPRVSRRLS